METHETGLSPPKRLAVAYAPEELRPALALLLAFDARFEDIVAKSTEPLIGQIKLAWWRDAIAVESELRPRGEPLFAQLNATTDKRLEPALLDLVDAWETLLLGDDVDAFSEGRGRAIFSSYARWVGSVVDVGELGAGWAADSLAARRSSLRTALPGDRTLRPLTILALSVRDISGPRLLWHALTGR